MTVRSKGASQADWYQSARGLGQPSACPYAKKKKQQQPCTHGCLLFHWNNFMSVICWHLTTVFSSASAAKPQFVPVIPAHCMSHFSKLEFSHSMFQLDWSPYLLLSWSIVYRGHTYNLRPVSKSREVIGSRAATDPILRLFYVVQPVSRPLSLTWRRPSLSRRYILSTAEIHDYCMVYPSSRTHDRWLKESFCPGRRLLLGRYLPSGVVFAPPLINPSGGDYLKWGRLILCQDAGKSLTWPLSIM